jgi:hypothetical protein
MIMVPCGEVNLTLTINERAVNGRLSGHPFVTTNRSHPINTTSLGHQLTPRNTIWFKKKSTSVASATGIYRATSLTRPIRPSKQTLVR